MKMIFWLVFVAIDICACFTNCTTLVYITKTYNIKIHVFTLIFLDSLISTTCYMIVTFLDLLLLARHTQPNYLLYFFTFLFTYYPNCCGAFLTLLISLLRYCLAKKSAQNIQPSNKKVSLFALAIFMFYAIFIITTCVLHAVFDLPLAFFIEVLSRPQKSPRTLRQWTMIFLQIPNFCNLLSLVTDIQMLKFLKKVIIPTKENVLSGLGIGLIFVVQKSTPA